MSNDTQSALSKAPYAPREGVFIPRKQVQKMRRVRDLLDDARRHARDMLKDAQQQADAIRREAFAAGYEDGVLASASQVLAHFDATQAQALRMRGALERHAGDLLSAALDHPDTVLALLDQCLRGLAGPADQRIRIILPESMRGTRPRLNAMLAETGRAAVNVEYGDQGNQAADTRLVVLAGEQVFEFDPPASIAQGQRQLLAHFPDLADACRKLGDDAMQCWREAFEERFEGRDMDVALAGDERALASVQEDEDQGEDDEIDDVDNDDDDDDFDETDDEMDAFSQLDHAFFDDPDDDEEMT